MKFTKKQRFLVLILWTAFLSLVYWGLGNTPLTMPITYSYFGLCLVLSILFVLVSGGLTPVLQSDCQKKKRSRERNLRDQACPHPVKKKDKYRRFQMEKEGEEIRKENDPPRPTPNLFKIPEKKRAFASQVLLVLAAPFYIIFLLDWILLHFFA